MATDDDRSKLPSRHAFLRNSIGLIPAVALAGGGVAGAVLARAPTPSTSAHQPSYSISGSIASRNRSSFRGGPRRGQNPTAEADAVANIGEADGP